MLDFSKSDILQLMGFESLLHDQRANDIFSELRSSMKSPSNALAKRSNIVSQTFEIFLSNKTLDCLGALQNIVRQTFLS